jgi:hypothetical protein
LALTKEIGGDGHDASYVENDRRDDFGARGATEWNRWRDKQMTNVS